MYRSLYFKIILILIVFVTTVMALVGTILLSGVTGYFSDDFKNQMDACFADDTEMMRYLTSNMANGEGAEALNITLNAYSGSLGLDDYRAYAVLSPDGEILAAAAQNTMFAKGGYVTLTPNILAVMNGRSGTGQQYGADYFDYCIRLSGDGDSLLIYVRDSKQELANLSWMLFTIILQALLFGMLFAIILSFFLAKTITAPIQSLTRGAQQMAAGEFENEIDVHSEDEIGTLTDTFNHMKVVLKNTLDQVSGERKKLETVFYYLKDAVIAFREDGSVMHLNTTARDLFAAREPDAEGVEKNLTFSGMLAICGIEDTPKFREDMEDDLKNSPDGCVIRELTIGERVFDLSLGNYNYVEENEMQSGIIAVVHDVTGRYELDRSRREFVANVSHELRTPLTSIKGAAETVLRYPDMPEEMRENFLEMAVEESDRMTRIVGDLLVLSRLDNNRTKWEISTFSVDGVLQHLCEVIGSDASAHGHTVTLRVEDNMPEIMADKDRIEQVLLNILSNSVKYTPDGGHILVRAMALDGFVGISIRDNGMGIPEEDLPHLFERFYRVEKSRTTGAGGTGLGLAIAKELVDAHGGMIHVESKLGEGTEITVLLPVECRLNVEKPAGA
ncbi:MAG: cell wall metabolism sensor histidine kinase WalK [Clostridia bacterium]|nr:cell wall metabolism sensor histidine kinase WalK [Clostridia bacterium]